MSSGIRESSMYRLHLHHRGRRRALVSVAALVAALFPVLVITAAPAANAAGFTEGIHVTPDLTACNNDGTITFPANGPFICPDSAYVEGNLGKGWNELDLVPHRLTTKLGNQTDATTSYNMIAAADYQVGSNLRLGYDFISDATVHTGSDASCTISAVDSGVTSGGGTLKIIYKTWSIHQAKGSTCIFDYYQRLALGSHLYPGSSLQSYEFTQADFSGGNQTMSLPVNEIAPQALSKDMTATQDSDHIWDVTKSPTPASLSFSNTCDPSAPLSAGVAIKVSWTKEAATASGDITVITHVYATNPAARAIDTSVTDVIYAGTTVLDTSSAGPTTVPANTANFLMLSHTLVVPAGTSGLHDIATGTYTDNVTQIPIPGTTTATASASVTPSGVVTNNTAVINDVESITGSGLSYSVDSFSGASGSFDGGYLAGVHTTGSVSWTSDSQSASGSVTFNKTVYATAASIVSGSLDDTATLTGSDGFTASSPLSVGLSTNATTSLSVSKSTTLKVPSAQTFTFHLIDASTNSATGDIATVNMPANSNGPVSSNTISGLSATGSYYFHEDATAPYGAQDTGTITFSLVSGDRSSCSAVVPVTNTAELPTAQVKKDTVPTSSGNWTFTLTGPNGFSKTLTNVTAGGGYIQFPGFLDGGNGTYTITETQQSGYDLTQVTGDLSGNAGRVTKSVGSLNCSFTLDITTDHDTVFECAFTNTKEGTIIVKKVTDPTTATDKFTFTGDAAGSIGNGETITKSNLVPGTYYSTEAVPNGWDLTNISCDDANSTGNTGTAKATFILDPGETVTCTFSNRQRGTATVIKTVNGAALTGSQSFTFQLRTGASASSAGTILESGTATAGNGGEIDFATYLVPGQTYQLCEQMQPGWTTSLGPPLYSVYNPSGDNSVVCTDFTVTAGQAKVFAIDNQPPPGGMALTIGYWKNWSSCSGGKQKAVLDQTLLAAANAGHPITIGTLVLNPNVLGAAKACQYAVNLLNKTTIDGKKKLSSDPLFNMAAQLLAAMLNVQAGAGQCAASATAINQAQALLVKYHFDGLTYTPKLTASDANLANQLATTLDKYNNNQLC
jgi:hypothetical protein